MEHVVLRTAHAANQIPQELPAEASRLPRGERHRCDAHGDELVPVVVTTFGPTGDPETRRARPLAHDAWRCPRGDHLILGAHLTAAEISALAEDGAAAARSGDLDTAEYNFRRMVSAWPGYPDGHANLGAVYVDRVGARQRAGAGEDEWRPLLDVAIASLERALACDPPAGAQARAMLGRIQARLGQTEAARATLAPVLDDPNAAEPFVSIARGLLAELGPAPGPTFEHPWVQLSLPEGWRAVDAPQGLAALFEGPDHEMVNVALVSSPGAQEAHLEHMMAHHAAAVGQNYPQCDAQPPERADRPAYLAADRVLQVDGDGRPWTIHARYAIARGTELTDQGMIHPAIQIVYYGSSWGPSPAVVQAIRQARLIPRMAQVMAAMAAPSPAPAAASAPIEDLEQAVLRLKGGESRAELEAMWPADTAWTFDEATSTLTGRPEAVRPFEIRYLLPGGRLERARLLTVRVGDWALMENLEQHLLYQLPNFTFTSVRDPWTLAAARGRLEGKGNARAMMAVPIEGQHPDGARVSGKALAYNVEGRQHYGFELTWRVS